MAIEDTLEHRRAAGILVSLKSTDPQDLASLATCFEDDEGSRGHLLAAAGGGRKRRDSPAPQMLVFPKLGMAYGAVTREGLDDVRKHKSVGKVTEANSLQFIRPVPYLAADAPEKPSPGPTWGIKALKVDQLWAEGLTGAGVLVAHLDTGIDGNHPMLEGAIEKAAIFDFTGREKKADNPPTDSGDHGTHTAGTIVGRTHKKVQAGVAPNAKLLTAEVIEGGDSIARVLGGINWGLLHGARVVNLSLGWRGYTDAFLMLFDAIRSNECLPVVASGNEGEGYTRSPGNYVQALSVGAIAENGKVPNFSGSEMMNRDVDSIVPDIIAPGDGIWSAAAGGGFAVMRGTSMATPHVSGLVALLMEAYPSSTIAQVEEAVFASAGLSSKVPPTRGGRGLPDGMKALKLLGSIVGAA